VVEVELRSLRTAVRTPLLLVPLTFSLGNLSLDDGYRTTTHLPRRIDICLHECSAGRAGAIRIQESRQVHLWVDMRPYLGAWHRRSRGDGTGLGVLLSSAHLAVWLNFILSRRGFAPRIQAAFCAVMSRAGQSRLDGSATMISCGSSRWQR